MTVENRNRTVVQRTTGDLRDAIEILETPIPTPGAGELLVQLVVAPINPAENLMMRGEYGYGDSAPSLPRSMGIEGVGRVVDGATEDIPVGSHVSLAGTRDVFSDFRLLRADRALVLPHSIDVDTFAVSYVNVQSVLLMLSEWEGLHEGDWLIQNAANSAYARVLDAVAGRRGLRVVNVVRSAESAAKIDGLMQGPVIVEGQDLDEQVLGATAGVRPKVAIDAVGGQSTGRLASVLAHGGRVVTYGLLSGQEIQLDTRLVVFNDIRLGGFWMPRSMMRTPKGARREIGREAIEIIADRSFEVPVTARYDLADIREAVSAADGGGRDGKVVVTSSPSPLPGPFETS